MGTITWRGGRTGDKMKRERTQEVREESWASGLSNENVTPEGRFVVFAATLDANVAC